MKPFYNVSSDPCAVYVVAASADGPVKIGLSRDPEKRVATLQTGSAHKLHLFGIYWLGSRRRAEAVEAGLLDSFKDCAVAGEWINAPLRKVCQRVHFKIFLLAQGELTEWEHCFAQDTDEKLMLEMHPELRFADPNEPTPQELGVEHAASLLGFGA